MSFGDEEGANENDKDEMLCESDDDKILYMDEM
jgi:hypothetical protein